MSAKHSPWAQHSPTPLLWISFGADHPCAYMLSVLTSVLHTAATETVQGPAKPKIFNTVPLGEKFADLGIESVSCSVMSDSL